MKSFMKPDKAPKQQAQGDMSPAARQAVEAGRALLDRFSPRPAAAAASPTLGFVFESLRQLLVPCKLHVIRQLAISYYIYLPAKVRATCQLTSA